MWPTSAHDRGFAQSLSGSSLRTQGPITPGLKSEKKPLLQCRNESPRRMGPCVRRDDPLRGGAHASGNDERPLNPVDSFRLLIRLGGGTGLRISPSFRLLSIGAKLDLVPGSTRQREMLR